MGFIKKLLSNHHFLSVGAVVLVLCEGQIAIELRWEITIIAINPNYRFRPSRDGESGTATALWLGNGKGERFIQGYIEVWCVVASRELYVLTVECVQVHIACVRRYSVFGGRAVVITNNPQAGNGTSIFCD